MTQERALLLVIEILHYLKDPNPKLRELWSIPYYGYCRMYTINRQKPRERQKSFFPKSHQPQALI